MPRIARIVLPGYPHHITQRGNNRQDTFFTDDDRRAYLAILRSQAKRYGLTLLGYCLMTNHVHLVVIPQGPDSLNKAIGRTHWIYSQAINRWHGRSGHLWQSRFYSCALDDAHLIAAMAYLERNPVRAGLARVAWKYPWSSAEAHLNLKDPQGLISLDRWRVVSAHLNWRQVLERKEEAAEISRLRIHTRRGRPLAGDRFLSKLETALGRRLRPLPRGRPKTKPKK